MPLGRPCQVRADPYGSRGRENRRELSHGANAVQVTADPHTFLWRVHRQKRAINPRRKKALQRKVACKRGQNAVDQPQMASNGRPGERSGMCRMFILTIRCGNGKSLASSVPVKQN